MKESKPGNASVDDLAPSNEEARGSGVDADQWVESYADFLYRHAILRVGDVSTAQDLVQEVFLAAWRARQKHTSVASEKAWLLSILRNKAADYYRRQARHRPIADTRELRDFEEQQFDESDQGDRHWRAGPQEWLDPGSDLVRAEFWKVLHACTRKLPVKTARVFVLREVDELSVDEICRLLDIRQNHLFVMLHRARLALRSCLERSWFGRPSTAEERKDER